MDRIAFEQQARSWRKKALGASLSNGAGRDEAEVSYLMMGKYFVIFF